MSALATWLVSDPSLGKIERGLFTPASRGEIEIRASFDRFASEPGWMFLVDPTQPSHHLYFVSGIVRDSATNNPLEDASVEIIEGYNLGERAATNRFGHYRIGRVFTSVDFRARASKEGYEPSVVTYRVDPPFGLGNPPVLDFRLVPRP